MASVVYVCWGRALSPGASCGPGKGQSKACGDLPQIRIHFWMTRAEPRTGPDTASARRPYPLNPVLKPTSKHNAQAGPRVIENSWGQLSQAPCPGPGPQRRCSQRVSKTWPEGEEVLQRQAVEQGSKRESKGGMHPLGNHSGWGRWDRGLPYH